jgi:hypothetical protein
VAQTASIISGWPSIEATTEVEGKRTAAPGAGSKGRQSLLNDIDLGNRRIDEGAAHHQILFRR